MIFKMLKSPIKYIKLNGEPLGYPKILSKIMHPGTYGIGAGMLAVAALNGFDKRATKDMAVPAAILFTIDAFGRKRQQDFLEARYGKKVITTAPSAEQSFNSVSRYGYKAKVEQIGDAVGVGLGLTISAAMYYGFSEASLAVVFAANVLGDDGGKIYRFRQIAKGNWAIVDEPPKEKVLEHFKPAEKQQDFVPAPQGV